MKMITTPQLLIVLINLVSGLTEFFLGTRLVLKLFGASIAAPFVNWIYDTTQPLLYPFIGMFPSPKLPAGLVIEFPVLFALMVYAFVGYLAVEAIETVMYFGEQRDKTHKN